MGARLTSNKVDALVNPFGTVFQPLALSRLLRAAAGEEVDWQQHLVQARGRWQSYDLHGSIGADSPVALLQLIQALVQRTGEFLRGADAVALTLGTAWAYRLRETGELVNNCHKQSADLFVRELLTPDDIINGLAETHAYLRRINPELRFILTVSPVRHLKDTLPLNAVSKSVLRVATHILSDLLPDVEYFPAYELLTDDLRDYRFYADDMLHPSEVAEDYIWDKFARTYFDADFGRFRKEWAAVRQSLGHRPLHAGAPEHRQFLESTQEKLEQLSLRKVDVSAELQQVRTQLAALPVPQQPEPAVEIEDDEERIDIGDGAPAAPAQATTPRAAEASPSASRPPRLSPEEFRAQRAARPDRPERGRRDGRGKGRVPQPTENEQFQTTSFDAAGSLASPDLQEEKLPAVVTPAALVTPEASTTPSQDAPAAEQEAGLKKKRRSRGGAKRTARKNALRLAAEMGVDADQADDLATAPDAASGDAIAVPIIVEGQNTRREGQKSSVITKSQPVKRGGRRDESGRVPRVSLFAEPALAAAEMPMADAELPVLIPMLSLETPAVQAGEDASDTETFTPSRNSRNRNKRKAANAGADASETTETSAAVATDAAAVLPIANAEQLFGATEPEARPQGRGDNQRQPQVPVAALPVTTPDATAVSAVESVANPNEPSQPPTAKRSNRKSRAVSGGRAEKPAVDTPVIPVQDASAVRTQVAAGRMTGSSATLVEPSVMPRKAATKAVTVKPAVPKAKPATAPVAASVPVVVAPEVPASASKPKTAAKAKFKKTAPTAVETPAAKAVVPAKAAKPAAAKPAVVKKSPAVAAKPVAAVTVATKPPTKAKPAAKTVTKPAPKPADVQPVATKAAGSKASPTAKAPAKPAAAKPKTPKKPAK
ncbi:hypothetical protein GCM10022407_23190 [Hymenobacter antarcticus]|uniref:GSCFA domain-containing protein n=2 Tax=Hymenobacter antarcticus TaxID=486270 RepID=A0ABP7Q663_9BACT